MEPMAFTSKRTRLLQLIDKLDQQITRSRRDPDPHTRATAVLVETPRPEGWRDGCIRVGKPGKVILDDGELHLDCVIEDVTYDRAELRLSCIFTLPRAFDLTVVGGQTVFTAAKVWQSGVKVGVRFTDVQARPG